VVEFALLGAYQALIQEILVLELIDVLISVLLLALDVILSQRACTHRSQWSQPIHLSSSSFSQLLE
jgi:uncharacterized membrane protein